MTPLDAARGKWHGVLEALGVPKEILSKKHMPCPFCGGKDRFRWTNNEGTGSYVCNGCGNGTVVDLLAKYHGWDTGTVLRKVQSVVQTIPGVSSNGQAYKSTKDYRAEAAKLWRQTRSVRPEDPVDLYLAGRNIHLRPPVVRTLDAAECWSDKGIQVYPAMIAKIQAPNGESISLHRTYLTQDGKKAPVDRPKRMMPGPLTEGCAIRLSGHDAHIGIAEGIETALSCQQMFDIPTWAVFGTRSMMKWKPPEGVREITVFGDNDENAAGQAAAWALVHKLRCKGEWKVNVEFPQGNEDFNDVLTRGVE